MSCKIIRTCQQQDLLELSSSYKHRWPFLFKAFSFRPHKVCSGGFWWQVIMRPPMSKGVLDEVKSDIAWGKARTRSCREVESRLVHPKVARWAEKEYQNVPYFIKVISSTSDHNRHKENHGTLLALPASFIREHFLKLDKDVVLEDAKDGRTWNVSFQGQGYKVWRQGFPVFAQDNHLSGNTIVFALVAHSRFHFTLFNDQGCQIIPHFRAKREIELTTEKKDEVYKSSFHSPSCPKHYSRRRVQPKLESQVNEANTSHDVKTIAEDFAAENVGQNKACRFAVLHSFQQPKRRLKASASYAANDNHHICIHMGFSCGLHQHEVKPKVQPVNQTLDQSEDKHSLDECQNRLEQFQIVETCQDSNQPLVEERALSEMTTSEANSENGDVFGLPDDQPMKAAHLDPIWFIFMSKRKVVTNAERREARNTASRYSRILRRPNSITVMKTSQVYKEFIMELPKTLVLLGGTLEFPQPALTLVDSTGRSWEMQWYASGRHRLALVPKDWALFSVHHFLEEGDACVFEATDIEALTILVRIFRVVNIPDNLGTDGIYTHYSVEFAS